MLTMVDEMSSGISLKPKLGSWTPHCYSRRIKKILSLHLNLQHVAPQELIKVKESKRTAKERQQLLCFEALLTKWSLHVSASQQRLKVELLPTLMSLSSSV